MHIPYDRKVMAYRVTAGHNRQDVDKNINVRDVFQALPLKMPADGGRHG